MRAAVLSAARAGVFAGMGTFATTAAAKVLGMSAVAWMAVAGSLTVAGGGAYLALKSASPPDSQHETASLPRAAAGQAPARESSGHALGEPAPPPTAEAVAALPPQHVKPRASDPKPKAAPAPSADTGFTEDARLLREVRAALSAGQNDRALALLEQRQASGAKGVLDEEREAARIVTLCKLGRQTEAQAAASRFLAAHASSPLAERVRRACPAGARTGTPR